MAKEEKIKYVANTTLQRLKGGFIPMGTAFYEEDINPHGFKAFLADGTVFPLDQAEVVMNKLAPGMRNLVTGIEAEPQLIKKGSLNNKVAVNIPATVWDFDPEKIKNMAFEILMAMYKERCEKYKITPQKFSTKEEVLAQLTSQFVKK